jgi:hypothetical protein
MALDLTLCVVPRQIDTIVLKAETSPAYAEWIASVPDILKNPNFEDFQDAALVQLKWDVSKLKQYFEFTERMYFYDQARCSATIDYLLNEYLVAHRIDLPNDILWRGGDVLSAAITGVQGVPVRLYNAPHIQQISQVLATICFDKLLAGYDYDKMQTVGVYKLVSAEKENIDVMRKTFEEIKDVFLRASLAENQLIFQHID